MCCITERTGYVSSGELLDIILGTDKNTIYSYITQNELYDGDNNYIRLQNRDNDNPITRILNKIQKGNDILGNICKVNTGLFTACDKVFILNKTNINNTIPNLNKLEYDILKPLFKNSDICKYTTKIENNKVIIYHYEKTNYDLTEVPNLINYLRKYKNILENRKDNSLKGALKRGRWDVISLPKTAINFNGPKIVAPQRSNTNTFGYNEVPWYASADVYFITSPKNGFTLKYILGLLNSKLYYFWLYHKGKLKGITLELYQKPLSEIPIKYSDEQDQIVKIVDLIINKTKNGESILQQEKELNQLIYDLYKISKEEQAFIDAFQ